MKCLTPSDKHNGGNRLDCDDVFRAMEFFVENKKRRFVVPRLEFNPDVVDVVYPMYLPEHFRAIRTVSIHTASQEVTWDYASLSKHVINLANVSYGRVLNPNKALAMRKQSRHHLGSSLFVSNKVPWNNARRATRERFRKQYIYNYLF